MYSNKDVDYDFLNEILECYNNLSDYLCDDCELVKTGYQLLEEMIDYIIKEGELDDEN